MEVTADATSASSRPTTIKAKGRPTPNRRPPTRSLGQRAGTANYLAASQVDDGGGARKRRRLEATPRQFHAGHARALPLVAGRGVPGVAFGRVASHAVRGGVAANSCWTAGRVELQRACLPKTFQACRVGEGPGDLAFPLRAGRPG